MSCFSSWVVYTIRVLFVLPFFTDVFYTYPWRLLHQHWGDLKIAPLPVTQPKGIWMNRSYEVFKNGYCNRNKTKHANPLVNLLEHILYTSVWCIETKQGTIWIWKTNDRRHARDVPKTRVGGESSYLHCISVFRMYVRVGVRIEMILIWIRINRIQNWKSRFKLNNPWEHIRVIKNNAWVTVNNDFFVTSEAIRQWFSSRVKIIAESPHEWQKIVIHGNECIILFLTCYFMSWTHKSAIIERSFRHCCQGRPFLTEHCDVTTIDLWRHANAKYWYCDVIFVYCHCTRKLAQRRSSLVNNSREYRYLATRYSRLSV